MRHTSTFLALIFALFAQITQAQPGSLDLSFDPGAGFNGPVNALVAQPDNKVICVGQFTTYQGVARKGIARINPDGTLDATFNPGTGFAPSATAVNAVVLLSDGKIMCGGAFTNYNGTPRANLVRLNANGTLDGTFNQTGTGLNGNVFTIHIDQTTARIYCGGVFTSYNGTSRNRIARFTSTGALDLTFDPGTGFTAPFGGVSTIVQAINAAGTPTSDIVCGGDFTTYRGVGRTGLCGITSTGTAVAAFNSTLPAFIGSVNVVSPLIVNGPLGRGYYVGGTFTAPATRMCFVSTTGTVLASYPADGQVSSVVCQPGVVNPVVTGGFTVGGGALRNRITRITSANLNDGSFAIGTGFNAGGAKACLAPNGRIYAAGNFTSYNGVMRNGIARIHDQVSPSTLTVQTGGDAAETTWRVENPIDLSLLASGSNMANNSTLVYTINVPKSGCAIVRFNDTGANGLQGGGWVLRDELGNRILDNTANGDGFTTGAVSPSLCAIPLSTLQLIPAHQDKLDWTPSDVMTCAEDPLVTAQWGTGVQTDDGYEFGFFDAVGLGSQTSVFRSHADIGGITPANGQRARSLLMSSAALYLLSGRLENVRIRSRVNGVNGPWGPVCRMRITVPSTPCVTTQLYSTGAYASCNTTRTVNAGYYVDAVPAWRFGGTYGFTLQASSLYKFKFTSGNFTRIHVSSAALPITEDIWNSWKFLCGTNTYQVSVAVSFDGTTWCPYGPACPVTIIDNSGFCAPAGSSMAPFPADGNTDEIVREAEMTVWPNPSQGGEVTISVAALPHQLTHADVLLVDALGREVRRQRVQLIAGGKQFMLTTDGLPAGIYSLTIVGGATSISSRLVLG